MKQNSLIRIIIFLIILNITAFGYFYPLNLQNKLRRVQYKPLQFNKTNELKPAPLNISASAHAFLNPEFNTGIDVQKIIPPFKKTNNVQNAGDAAGTRHSNSGGRHGAFMQHSITAKSAIVKDITTGKILFEKNPNQQMPIASLTKIMTGLVVLENIESNQIIKISQRAFDADGFASGLFLGEEFEAKDLLKIMLIESSNDAAEALSEQVASFIEKMNKKAYEIGMLNTKFTDASGLDQNNVSIIEDLIRLIEYSSNSEIWRILSKKSETVFSYNRKFEHNLRNTNKLLNELEIFSGKTGYTEEAGQALIVLSQAPNKDIITSVILNSEDRFADMQKLLKWCFENYSWSF